MDEKNDSYQPMWTFLSHSSEDVAKVKRIRDFCEECGMDALMFNLRGLAHGTEEEKELLIKLIRAEIEARDWFILCQSKNTGGTNPGSWNSEWVEEEWNYADKIGKTNKVLLSIDSEDENIIKDKIHKLNTYHDIFISYLHADSLLARTLRDELVKKGFNVFMDTDTLVGEQIWDSVESHIRQCNLGIVLVTDKTINSQWVKAEIDCMKRLGKTILPIYVRESENDEMKIPDSLYCMQFFVTTRDRLADDSQSRLISIINKLLN